VAQGLLPQNVVNPEVAAQPGFRVKLARFAANQQQRIAHTRGGQ
jgi:hypothetical protein